VQSGRGLCQQLQACGGTGQITVTWENEFASSYFRSVHILENDLTLRLNP
jgi:hypothetical protein